MSVVMLPQSALAQTTKAGTIGENTIALSANLTPTTLSFEISEAVTAITQTDEDPTVLTYSDLTIQNLMQTGKLEVEKLELTGSNGYTAAGDSTDWKNLSVIDKKFSMLASCGDITGYDLSNQLRRSVEIQNNGSVTYSFTGHTGISAEGFNGAIAQLVVTVTLKYAEPTAIKLYGTNLTFKTASSTQTWDGTLQTSIDGKTWQDYTAGTTVTADSQKKTIWLRGSNNTYLSNTDRNINVFSISGSNVAVSGNIDTLLDYTKVDNGQSPNAAEATFKYLFANNSAITDAANLVLKRATLPDEAYNAMFRGCTNLINAPMKIDSNIVGKMSCQNMFLQCAKLTNAPTLPAQYIYNAGYNAMFRECTALQVAPELPATNTENMYNSYSRMFQDCVSLIQPPSKLGLKTVPFGNYSMMFSGCSKLEKLPKIEANKFYGNGCAEMFKGCTKIKLSETQGGEYTTPYMVGASNATLYTGSNHTKHLRDMFTGTGGTFTGTPSINTTYYTSNEIVG